MRGEDRTRIGSGLLAVSCFALGAAFAAVVRGGTQWGTVGEWVGGFGGLAAALVALQLGRSAMFNENRRTEERRKIAGVRVIAVLCDAALAVERVRVGALELGPEDRLAKFESLVKASAVMERLAEFKDVRAEGELLSAGNAVQFEKVFALSKQLADGLDLFSRVTAKGKISSRLLAATLPMLKLFAHKALSLAEMCDGLERTFDPSLVMVLEKDQQG